MSTRSSIIKIILPLVIILVGAGVMAALVKNRPAPKKKVRDDPGALVRVIEVKKADRRVAVKGTGTVQPARSVKVIPQVSGRVRSINPSLVAGGFFRDGEPMFGIDDADYRLAVERAAAAKIRAEYELTRMESQALVARAEWDRLDKEDNGGAEPNPLVLYEPQLKDVRGALRGASAALEQAKLDLERTTLRAPFNCVVLSESVDVGQYISPATAAATLAGTDEAEVIVPLPLDDMAWVEVPRSPGATGSRAVVAMDVAGARHTWEGTVIRSLGEVDPNGRMLRVVVSVQDPYGLSSKAPGRPPLAFGAFVEVRIDGKTAHGVVTIPRGALRDGSTVWTVDEENRLRIKEVEPLRVEHEEVLLAKGLEGGEKVIITTLSGAADGMKLRPFSDGKGREGL
ncbi:MAG: efflux RND transporter periplasmic adaptor subunit [Thermodesulfobacteriota bacterium]